MILWCHQWAKQTWKTNGRGLLSVPTSWSCLWALERRHSKCSFMMLRGHFINVIPGPDLLKHPHLPGVYSTNQVALRVILWWFPPAAEQMPECRHGILEENAAAAQRDEGEGRMDRVQGGCHQLRQQEPLWKKLMRCVNHPGPVSPFSDQVRAKMQEETPILVSFY